MQNKSFSSLLQDLCNKHYNHRISFDEYRTERRRLIDKIDKYYNEVICEAFINPSEAPEEALAVDADDGVVTQPYLSSIGISEDIVMEVENKKV